MTFTEWIRENEGREWGEIRLELEHDKAEGYFTAYFAYCDAEDIEPKYK